MVVNIWFIWLVSSLSHLFNTSTAMNWVLLLLNLLLHPCVCLPSLILDISIAMLNNTEQNTLTFHRQSSPTFETVLTWCKLILDILIWSRFTGEYYFLGFRASKKNNYLTYFSVCMKPTGFHTKLLYKIRPEYTLKWTAQMCSSLVCPAIWSQDTCHTRRDAHRSLS